MTYLENNNITRGTGRVYYHIRICSLFVSTLCGQLWYCTLITLIQLNNHDALSWTPSAILQYNGRCH